MYLRPTTIVILQVLAAFWVAQLVAYAMIISLFRDRSSRRGRGKRGAGSAP